MSKPDRYWNYRVLRHRFENGETQLQIHEVHYRDGKPSAYSEPMAGACCNEDEGVETLQDQLALMAEAIVKPILEADDFTGGG